MHVTKCGPQILMILTYFIICTGKKIFLVKQLLRVMVLIRVLYAGECMSWDY